LRCFYENISNLSEKISEVSEVSSNRQIHRRVREPRRRQNRRQKKQSNKRRMNMNITYSQNFQPVAPQNPALTPGFQFPVGTPENGAATPAKPLPLAYTVEEAAAALNVCTKTIRRLLDRGILTASKALRKKLIPRSQIEGFLKATCEVPKTLR
jgi:excisionase family DNA binding protein